MIPFLWNTSNDQNHRHGPSGILFHPRKICGRDDHGYRYYYTYYYFSNAVAILQRNYRKEEPNTSFFMNKEIIVQRVSLWRMRVSRNETDFD